MRCEAWRVFEDAVNSEQRRRDVDRRRCDPQVIGVASIVKRVTGASADVAYLRSRGDQRVTDGNNRRRSDRLLEPLAPRCTPSCDERAVAEFADSDGCQKDLVPRHEPYVSAELRASALTE